jgi:hypothetical protein
MTFGGIGLTLFLFAITLAIGLNVLWIWMLVEVLTRETDESNTRLLWTLVIIFTHWLGALIYLIVRRPERVKTLGR